MIRVLHVIGAMDRGGAETMIMNFYRKMDLSKYQFDFLVHETRKCDYDDEIRERGGNIYSVSRYKIFNYSAYKKEIRDFFLERHDYDIVHGHICSSINIYLKEARKYGIKTIAHSHSSNFGFSLDTLFTKIVSLNTVNIADYFFGCSLQAGIDRYGKKIVSSSSFSILNNGIDTDLYRFDQDKRIQLQKQYHVEGSLVFGHVGRLTHAKNHDFLLRVFKCILGKYSNSELFLFGRGELEEEIKKKIEDLGIQEHVHLMGVVDNVYDYMQMLDVFLFPSKYEGLGIALVEAQASGLPCIINEDLPEEAKITDSVFGLSLNDSLEKWADLCIKVAGTTNRLEMNDLVQQSNFNINQEVNHLCQVYKNLSYMKR